MKRSPKNLREYKKVCAEIWKERPHICEDCGKPIGVYDLESGQEVPLYHNFAHGDRGRRKESDCLDKNNIKLKCMRCHSNNDHHQSVAEDNLIDNMTTRKSPTSEKPKKIKNVKVEIKEFYNHKTGKLEQIK